MHAYIREKINIVKYIYKSIIIQSTFKSAETYLKDLILILIEITSLLLQSFQQFNVIRNKKLGYFNHN